MRAPQERAVRDLYDRAGHKDLAPSEEPVQRRRVGGQLVEGSGHRQVVPEMEDKPTIRKRPLSRDSPRLKAESGTCNVCCAPCSSCLHRNFAPEDSNVDCASSQTCCARSETKNNSLIRIEKGLYTKGGENDDEFSATSSHASYSENGANKAMTRSSIGADSEVDMPAKCRRLLNHDARSCRVECQDDGNSCVTGVSAAGKLVFDKKKGKLSTSASSRDLTVKDFKDNNIASHNTLRNPHVEGKRSDVHVTPPSSSDRSVLANSPSVNKKLLRTQSSVSASQGLSPKTTTHGFGNLEDNLAHKPNEKTLSNNNRQHSLLGKLNTTVIGCDKYDMLTSYSASKRSKINYGSSSKDPEDATHCTRNGCQDDVAANRGNLSLENADIRSNDAAKRDDNDKQDHLQDCSMDISGGRKLNTQNDVADCGNSEGLIDVNVCDICGDVGREYLMATCTRCLEGAEHIYCMLEKLDKVPEGEWLCAECRFKEDQNKTRSNRGASTVNILNDKSQKSESMNNPKTSQDVVNKLDRQKITCSKPVTDHFAANNQKLNVVSVEPDARQIKCASPTVERLDAKNKNSGSIQSRRKLEVTSDAEARPSSCGTPTARSLDKKNEGSEARPSSCGTPTARSLDKKNEGSEAQPSSCGTPTARSIDKKNECSEVLLNRKKLPVATEIEPPLSSEGLQSPPKSCKRYTENTSSTNPRLFKSESPRKIDVLSRKDSFKKSNKGILKPHDNAPVRAKSSLTLSRSYSLGSMANVKAPVPSPRGFLSKQLSFNNSNNEPKVKQLADGVASKLKPAKHSPKDPREKGSVRKIVKSGSFKTEGSVCKESGSSKQKQPFNSSQNEKPRILKPMKEKVFLERRGSFNIQKPNIPSSPRHDGLMKPGDRIIDQDSPRPGPSILKCSKKPGNTEKNPSSILSQSEKQGITAQPMSVGVISAKDDCAVKTTDLPIPVENDKKNITNDGTNEASLFVVKNDDEIAKPEVLSTPCDVMAFDSDSQDMVPRQSTSEDLVPKVELHQHNILESTFKNAETVQAPDDMVDSSHSFVMAHNLCPSDDEPTEANLKNQDFIDQSSTAGNRFRAVAVPEQTYVWQGIFEVSRPGHSPEIYDGIQAHLSTCASPKVLEAIKQLPNRIQLAEVPRHSSWPLHFKKVEPCEDNIAIFFFAKDVESYERAYRKLLESTLTGDFSLTTNMGGTELLIFPSDKLPEKIQRWNGLLYFWGVFYVKKASSSIESLATRSYLCPLESIPGPVSQIVSSPRVPQSLGIDLNECPDDELSDLVVSLEPEKENRSASEDQKTLLRSKYEDAIAVSSGIHTPTISQVEGLDIKPDYPNDATGGAVTAGRDNMVEEGGFNQNEAPCHVKHVGAMRSLSDEISARKHAFSSFTEVSSQQSKGPKLSNDPSESIPKTGFGLHDSVSSYKRRKTSNGKHSACGFGAELLLSNHFSKIYPLPPDQHTPLDSAQPIIGYPTKPISDHIIHVLSSDDEDSSERSISLNKASSKAKEGSSPLLALSLSMTAKQNNLAGSETGDDGSLSLSLGLPVVVKGNNALEMKQFLPEKPGINT